MLDPDPYQMNTDPKPCTGSSFEEGVMLYNFKASLNTYQSLLKSVTISELLNSNKKYQNS